MFSQIHENLSSVLTRVYRKSESILLPVVSRSNNLWFSVMLHRIEYDDNALRSTLHIKNIDPSDFKGQYVCWMQNKHAMLNPARTLIIRKRRKLN